MNEKSTETLRDRMMPLDFAYYCDFAGERKITEWQVLEHQEGKFRLQSEFSSEEGEFWLLVNMAGVWESDRFYA